MSRRSRSPARLLAPIALIVALIAFVVVLTSSGTGDNSGSKSTSSNATTQRSTTTKKAPAAARRRSYTVKVGDTLGAIAERTGVPVATLQELNPAVDPQNLVAGQKIKLRE